MRKLISPITLNGENMDYDLYPPSDGSFIHHLQSFPRDASTRKWDLRFLRMAEEYATWSKDPSTQVGCVIVDPNTRRVLSGGYNGFPRGIKDTPERLNNRELKYKLIVHAEMNAIYNATASGVPLQGSTLYCVGLPTCSQCALGVIQTGIRRVVIGCESPIPEKWAEHWKMSSSLFEEAGINRVIYHDWKEH